ncbi:hypothetical protein FJY63_14980, partial [Candidatus Sumerlaeota bacterium]|nr:hypothetical protein [Candidatus Sumerlaeota bacterium]
MAVDQNRQTPKSTARVIPRGEEARGLPKDTGPAPAAEKARRVPGGLPVGPVTTAVSLGRVLEEAGLVSSSMLRDLQDRIQDEAGMSLRKAVVSSGLVREEEILDAIAQEMGLDKVALNEVKVTPELLSAIPPKVARNYRVFPIRVSDDTVYVALADPLNIQVMDDLERVLNKK